MRLDPLPFDQLDPDLKELVSGYGSFQTWTSVAGNHTALTKAIFQLLADQRQGSVLPPEIIELASVTVSLVNQCQYCIHQHSAKALGLGISQDQLDGLLDGSSKALFSERDWRVVDYARVMTQDVHALRAATLEALKQDWQPDQIVELTWRISFMNAFNRFNDALGIPPEQLTL